MRKSVMRKSKINPTFRDLRVGLVVVVGVLSSLSNVVLAGSPYDAGPLNFESTGQSIWSSGPGFRQDETVFVGTDWNAEKVVIDGITGSQNAQITPQLPNPIPFLPDLPAIFGDTRNGVSLKIQSSGRAGLEFEYSIDGGTIDSGVAFSAEADVPAVANRSEFINLGTRSAFENGSLETQSPRIQASISPILQVSGTIDATICGALLGCRTGQSPLPNIDLRDQPILSADLNNIRILDGLGPMDGPVATVPLLEQTIALEGGLGAALPPVPGFRVSVGGAQLVSTFPPTPSVSVELATIIPRAPDIATMGKRMGDSATSTGRDDFLSAMIDIDGAASILARAPSTGVILTPINLAPAFSLRVTLDGVDADAGPTLGVTQDFEITPTLMADVLFSSSVEIEGVNGLQRSWTGEWADLPEIAFLETTTVIPTFWVDVLLTNETGIDLGLSGTIELFRLSAVGVVGPVNVLNFPSTSLGALLGVDTSLFETDRVDFPISNTTFNLGGFNQVEGQAFTIVVVPEPTTIGLLAIGGLALVRRRRRAA